MRISPLFYNNYLQMDNIVLNKLESLVKLVHEQNLLRKEVLTFSEAAEYLAVSHSGLYKLTSSNTIPHYKPNKKRIYFKRSELDAWITTNRVTPKSELEGMADEYLMKKGKIGF